MCDIDWKEVKREFEMWSDGFGYDKYDYNKLVQIIKEHLNEK